MSDKTDTGLTVLAWLREQRGEYEGKETLDPFFVLGSTMPRNFPNGATYQPLVTLAEASERIRALEEQRDVARAEVERLRSDAERGRWLTEWLMEHGLLRAEFCKPGPGAECADWWILQKPYMVDRQSCEGYGKTEEEAIDAARKDKP